MSINYLAIRDYNDPCLTSPVIVFACFKVMSMLFAGIFANEIVTTKICRQNVLKELYLSKLAPVPLHLKSSEHSSQVVSSKDVFIEVCLTYSQVML